MNRREWLRYSAAAMLLPQALRAGPNDTKARPGVHSDQPQLRVVMKEADGSALDKDRAATLCARDLASDPLPQHITHAEGRARIDLAKEPIQLTLRLKVPDFGEIYCWADNGGKGYTAPGNIEFVIDAAATRLRRTKEAYESAKRELATIDPQTETYLKNAERPATDVRSAYAALSAGLHAGEQIALARARNRIARFAKPRKEFFFGCLIAGADERGPKYESLIRKRFNYATASWYIWGPEQPVSKRIDYSRMDRSLEWCWARGIMPKGFGYCYMTRGATPEWIRDWPFEKILPEYDRVVAETMRRYSGKLRYAEIINEAHDKSNLWKLSHSQILEITRAVCRAARLGSPTVKRQINNCCLWAEYARTANKDGSRRWSPYRYLSDCVSAGVDFDVVGLQLYYPQIDILEIERMLDRFKKFNKPIHITEIATASADGLDPGSMRPHTAAPGWHGPWSEATQADWLEAIYTLIYSKTEFEAIGWWDMWDGGGRFWPYGGMLRADMSPKLSYERLGELQKAWGVARSA